MNEKIYQKITDLLLERMSSEKAVPWNKPWASIHGGVMPQNGVSGHQYNGINMILLWGLGDTPFWATFNQIRKAGGKVVKGSKAQPIIFWKMLKVKDKETQEMKTVPMLKTFSVFNWSQTENMPDPVGKSDEFVPADHQPIEEAEAIVAAFLEAGGPEFKSIESDRAYYSKAEDLVVVPTLGQHESADEYYSTVFHELGHSTGHDNRLKRFSKQDGYDKFMHEYSREELVAEMTAAFVCGSTGIENTVDNSAAYLSGWMKKLQDDPKMLIWAAGRAKKAADMILGIESPYAVAKAA